MSTTCLLPVRTTSFIVSMKSKRGVSFRFSSLGCKIQSKREISDTWSAPTCTCTVRDERVNLTRFPFSVLDIESGEFPERESSIQHRHVSKAHVLRRASTHFIAINLKTSLARAPTDLALEIHSSREHRHVCC